MCSSSCLLNMCSSSCLLHCVLANDGIFFSTCRSIKSWDSHTHYQEFKEPDDDPVFFPSRPMQSIVCYCDMATLKTPRTILRVLLVVSCYTQRFLNFWKNPFAIFNWNLIGVDYCENVYLISLCTVEH